MVSSPPKPRATGNPVTIITQTRVLPDRNDDFAEWQQRISDAVAGFPGFLDHQVIPPNPPTQLDWVILQKFATSQTAQAWLRSPERLRLIETAQPMLVGHDDIHIIEDEQTGKPPDAVSAVISMRIMPGKEEAYRDWGQRIAAAQAQYPGFQGFKLNPPIPGVQEDWVTVLQFDNEAHLNAWMTSPERQKLLEEANAFTSESHVRTVRTGFDQWFRVAGAAQAPIWKMNMLTLLALYPVVFLFGYFVQDPLLTGRWGWPFFLALFAGNLSGVVILNWVAPWVSGRFHWWTQPAGSETRQRTLLGLVIVVALYALFLLLFSRFP
ncbi:MAG: antibiotic biosynthesis monooxygenase [Chloroflexi bacterium]|nr:antibiotic biosynthesis monooxygenase [Chloroflexota bacterium]